MTSIPSTLGASLTHSLDSAEVADDRGWLLDTSLFSATSMVNASWGALSDDAMIFTLNAHFHRFLYAPLPYSLLVPDIPFFPSPGLWQISHVTHHHPGIYAHSYFGLLLFPHRVDNHIYPPKLSPLGGFPLTTLTVLLLSGAHIAVVHFGSMYQKTHLWGLFFLCQLVIKGADREALAQCWWMTIILWIAFFHLMYSWKPKCSY